MTIQLISIIVASFSVMLISLIGVIFSWNYLKEWVQKYMLYLVSFSSGFFLVLSIHLILESIEMAPNIFWSIASFLLGILIFYFITFLFPEGHHHHDTSECHHKHNKNTARKMLIGDAVHNMGDGILLAPVFLIDIHLGMITTVGILIHEAIQEISEFIVLKEAGYTTKQALIRNFIASSTILIGAIAGYLFSSSDQIVSVLLGVAAGIFFYTVVVDLVPHSIKHSVKEKRLKWYIVWATIGLFTLFLVNQFSNHEALHHHEEDGHEQMHEDHHDDDHLEQ